MLYSKSYSANLSITTFCIWEYKELIQLREAVTQILLFVEDMRNSTAAGYNITRRNTSRFPKGKKKKKKEELFFFFPNV